ncbi:MAG: universal stress protein [Chloroflexota bacterium]
MLPYTRILIPLDRPPFREKAFDLAFSMARDTSAELFFLRLHPNDQDEEDLYTELKSMQAQLDDCCVPVRIEAAPGPPATAIIESAGQHRADLIVMPGHGYAGIGREVSGNIIEQVLHHTHCASLITNEA